MAAKSVATNVLVTATLLVTGVGGPHEGGRPFKIKNDGGATVYIGGPTVTIATGVPVTSGEAAFEGEAFEGEDVYGIAAGTNEVRVFTLRTS